MMSKLSLEKVVLSQGLAHSRKHARQLILQGAVSVVGVDQTLCLPQYVCNTTQPLHFTVHHQPYTYYEKLYIALYKPLGYECSHHPSHHPSVFSLLPAHWVQRGVQCVGRLDADTTGLLLLTDDGAWLHGLTHPKKHVPKRYVVDTVDPVTDAQIQQLTAGVLLKQEGNTLFCAEDIIQAQTHRIAFTVHQGVYHQVKRMLAAVGNRVQHLHREQVGQLCLSALYTEEAKLLPEGQWMLIDPLTV